MRDRSAKKNPDKHHLIPEPVRDLIETFKRKGKIESELPRSKAGMQKIFHAIFDPVDPKIEQSTGYREEGPGPYGWHSVRRRLVTSLGMIEDDDGELVFKESEIRRFMRWSDPDRSMYSEYFTPPPEWQRERDLRLDRKIFEHHPFLSAWKD